MKCGIHIMIRFSQIVLAEFDTNRGRDIIHIMLYITFMSQTGIFNYFRLARSRIIIQMTLWLYINLYNISSYVHE